MKMGMRIGPGLYEDGPSFNLRVKVTRGTTTTWRAERLTGVTRAQAEKRLAQLKREAAVEAESRNTLDKTSLAYWIARYVEGLGQRVAEAKITKDSATTTKDRLKTFVLPAVVEHYGHAVRLADLDVRDVRSAHVQQWVDELPKVRRPTTRRGRGGKIFEQKAEPYSKSTMLGAWAAFRACLTWITVRVDLNRNPANDVVFEMAPSATGEKKREWLKPTEVGKLLDAAREGPDRAFRVLLCVAFAGAMRASEVSGLQRDDVDHERGTVTINRSHVRGVFGPPKTVRSRREVVLPQAVLDDLRDLVAWQDKQPNFKGAPLLFPSRLGTARRPGAINKAMRACATKAAIKKRLSSHAIRRTTNALVLHAAGVAVAQQITGHTTQEMTVDRYNHVDIEKRHVVLADAFAGALGPKHDDVATAGATPEVLHQPN